MKLVHVPCLRAAACRQVIPDGLRPAFKEDRLTSQTYTSADKQCALSPLRPRRSGSRARKSCCRLVVSSTQLKTYPGKRVLQPSECTDTTMSQDSARGHFKPVRSSRASISVMPSTSSANVDSQQTLLQPAAHNAAAPLTATQSNRKKRAQSLGGDALDAARKRARGIEALRNDASANLALELSPGKLERRRAVSNVPTKSLWSVCTD